MLTSTKETINGFGVAAKAGKLRPVLRVLCNQGIKKPTHGFLAQYLAHGVPHCIRTRWGHRLCINHLWANDIAKLKR